MSENGKPKSLEAVIASCVRKTTGQWAKQRKREEKDATAQCGDRRTTSIQIGSPRRNRRRGASRPSTTRSATTVGFPRRARQLFYKVPTDRGARDR